MDRIVPDFARAGANIISFHPEASDHVDRTLGLIREHGCKAGLVLNPATPLAHLDHVLDKLDLILIMSVNPGFGGQQFIPEALKKLTAVRERVRAAGREIWIEVDGGIKVENIAAAARAGADTFVAGSAIFGSKNYQATIAAMRAELARSRRLSVAEESLTFPLRVKAVMIDLDGTLLDSIPDLAAAANGMLRELGRRRARRRCHTHFRRQGHPQSGCALA